MSYDGIVTMAIAEELKELNARFREEGRNYVLIGFGRWGSSIPTLGIPVVWSDISEVKALVECSLADFRVDPSQGSHFFQNLTSFNAGYISVDEFSRPSDHIDFETLDSMPAFSETRYLRHIRLKEEAAVCVDGRTGKAIMKI